MAFDGSVINCYDLEMCCWDDRKATGEIISIGIVQLDLISGMSVKQAHYYVKPLVDQVSQFCTSLTGITPSQISRQGRALEDVLDSVQRNFGGKRRAYVAWGDDAQVLAKEASEKGFELPFAAMLNAATLYSIKRRRSGKGISMLNAMAEHGLEFEGKPHNALTDAQNLARLVWSSSLF